jgi:hypothetical protein
MPQASTGQEECSHLTDRELLIVVGHLHHLIERMHVDALQCGLQVKSSPQSPGFQQLRFIIAVLHGNQAEHRRGRAMLFLGRFEPLAGQNRQDSGSESVIHVCHCGIPIPITDSPSRFSLTSSCE